MGEGTTPELFSLKAHLLLLELMVEKLYLTLTAEQQQHFLYLIEQTCLETASLTAELGAPMGAVKATTKSLSEILERLRRLSVDSREQGH